MPSLSSILKRSKTKSNAVDTAKPKDAEQNATNTSNGNSNANSNATATAESKKIERRQSRRADFFRGILGKVRQDEKPSSIAESKAESKPKPPILEPRKPTVPSTSTDAEKPLPPPPSQQKEEVRPKSAAASETGPAHLKVESIHKLFSGAPQFYVRSEGHHAGPPHPSVAFPWNEELEIRDLSDHGQIEDHAWSCVTTTPHIVRRTRGYKGGNGIDVGKGGTRAKWVPRAKERPNMLSMQGLERGTVGFQAALEIAVADALYEDKGFDDKTVRHLRGKFLGDKKHGLRHLDEGAILSRLDEISKRYHEKSPPAKTTVDWYQELFTRVLFPPTRVLDSGDPYSFHVQIEALLNVLTAPNIWVDFSNVEWRIRLGQILWTATDAVPPGEDDFGGIHMDKPETQRYWLLLQILLSCELVIRLDALTQDAERNPKLISLEETRRFERDCTRSVKWSLLLARIWLENIQVKLPPKIEVKPQPERRGSGWFATIKTAIAGEHVETPPVAELAEVEFNGRYKNRQVNGLVHFAKKLRWPDADNLEMKFGAQFEERAKSMDVSGALSGTATPVAAGTPLSMTTQKTSYFAGAGRPGIRRGLSQNRVSSLLAPSGWLSKSFLTGLILPGEGLSHFMISTLLENDEAAVARLGEDANLYGGFAYEGRTYWSIACVIGRVLAAGTDASECMGWLTSPVVPSPSSSLAEGWVNVQVELEPRSDGKEGLNSARIWKKNSVERDSYVLGSGDMKSVAVEDFSLPPPDVPDPVHLDVKLVNLNLKTAGSTESTPSKGTPNTGHYVPPREIRTYAADMDFTLQQDDEPVKNITFSLSYDVQFVTAYPCVPSPFTKQILPDEESPAKLNDPDLGPHTLFAGHALHKSFHFSRHTLTSVIFASPNSPPPLLSLHTSSTEVFVIDCTEPSPPESETMEAHPSRSAFISRKRRFGSDLEMLARAWCAEKGYNALISRKGRNCIACSIREARALSWKIVLRFG